MAHDKKKFMDSMADHILSGEVDEKFKKKHGRKRDVRDLIATGEYIDRKNYLKKIAKKKKNY